MKFKITIGSVRTLPKKPFRKRLYLLFLILLFHIKSGFAQDDNVSILKWMDIILIPAITHVDNDYNCVYNKSINKQRVYVIGTYFFIMTTFLTNIQD